MQSTRLPYAWGATPADLVRRYPADEAFAGPVHRLTRAVDVHAPADLAYRWLCQIRIAPYSYDLIDNLGRRSPQQLTPGADQLEVGDRVMVFRLTQVQPGRQWTGVTFGRSAALFGRVAATYAAEPVDPDSCRLVCRLSGPAPSRRGLPRAYALAWGDLIMMRRQLLNLKRLAERDAGRVSGHPRTG